MATPGEIKALKLQTMEFRLQEFVRRKVESIAEQTIVFEIKQIAQNMGMSNNYINSINIRVEGLGKRMKLVIDLDYFGEDGEPLGWWFEHGTKDHWIRPVEKEALHWQEGNEHFFSKGHIVSGIKPHKIFEQGLRLGMPEFIGRIKAELGSQAGRLFA